MRGVFQCAAVERHQALIAAHVGALIDGHGEMALAEQLAGCFAFRDRRGDALLIEPRASAHLVGRGEIDHQHADRTVALGLQDETPSIFKAEPSITVSTIASPSSLATGCG